MIVVPCGEFWIVIDPTGRVMAQGCRELCELVAKGKPIFSEQGSLWDDGTAEN